MEDELAAMIVKISAAFREENVNGVCKRCDSAVHWS